MAGERSHRSRGFGLLIVDLVVLYSAGSTFFDDERYPLWMYVVAAVVCILAVVFVVRSVESLRNR